MMLRHKDFLIENIKIPLMVSLVMAAISFYNYLLYHTLIELVAIFIGILLVSLIFVFKINFKDSFFPFIAIGYFYVSIIDLLHTLAYKGMNLLPIAGQSANLATQLWIEARFLQALILLAAVSFINKQIPYDKIMIVFGAVFCAVTLAVLSGYFPDCYIDGYGLTAFKIFMEYIIIAVLCFSLYRFYKNRDIIGAKTADIFMVSIVLTIFSELAFTFYISVFGFSNLIGHIFKFFAFWFILLEVRSIIESKYKN